MLQKLMRKAAHGDDRVGEWMREHEDEERAAVDELVENLQDLLECWM